MGNWFDGLAKRSARSAEAASPDAGVTSGLTRRQVLARGAAVTGVAWTAPMLLSAQPAWAVVSCPSNKPQVTTCPGGAESICCPEGQGCFKVNGKFVCDIVVGGLCGNNGFGSCNGGVSTCNQVCKDNATKEPICGGAGSTCGNNADCAEGRDCASGFCGGVGAVCSDSELDCSPGTCRENNISTRCESGFCVAE